MTFQNNIVNYMTVEEKQKYQKYIRKKQKTELRQIKFIYFYTVKKIKVDNVAKFCLQCWKKHNQHFSHYRDLIGRIKTQTPWMLQIYPLLYIFFTCVFSHSTLYLCVSVSVCVCVLIWWIRCDFSNAKKWRNTTLWDNMYKAMLLLLPIVI